jgi:hypothetical protein
MSRSGQTRPTSCPGCPMHPRNGTNSSNTVTHARCADMSQLVGSSPSTYSTVHIFFAGLRALVKGPRRDTLSCLQSQRQQILAAMCFLGLHFPGLLTVQCPLEIQQCQITFEQEPPSCITRKLYVSHQKRTQIRCTDCVLPNVQLCLQALDKLVEEAGGTVCFAASLEVN